ncbi:MAG: hypothetical protein FWE60_02500, partial [Oscillospiraceae bacterium]|nr:hypothetical protein [Oscillospiraceae bacterium]
LKDLSMTIGDIFLPQMREGVQEMTAMLKVGGEWVKENPEKVKQIVDTAAKLAVLTVGLKGAKLGYFALKGEIIGIRKLAAGATVDKGRLAKSAQTLVKGLKFMGPAGIVAVGALAAITAAIVINKKQMEELRKLYVDPLLFDNGGKKLSEFTDNLIESTRRSYEHAQAVNASKERISEIRGEIQRASGDLDFYGWSLRTNGILAPHEAEAMIEPFNRLAESLEENFQVRFTNVFDAFKIASTQVAENLGVDVAHISSILDGFKAKYTQNVSEARATTNAHLERVATGENLTAEDWEEYTRAMAYIRDSEAAASGEAREYEKIKENLSSIDFGSDYKEAIAEIRRLAEYADEYKNTLLEAQRTLDDDFAHLREQAKIDFEYGYKTAGELQNELDALQIAQHMTQLSTNQRIKDLDAEVGLFAGRMEGQVNFAEAKMLENAGGIKSHFVSLGASFQTGFGLWGNSYEQYVKNTVGGVFDVTRELEDLRKSTENSPLIIPIELDDSALRRFAARMPQRGDEYYMRHMGYVPKIHGSHAGGLDYVPFDGYRAELHKGERVLTAAESRDLFSLFNEFRPRPASSVGVKPLGISVADSSGKNITVKIEYAPNINFSGNPPEDLEEILRRNNEHLADEIEEKMRGVAEFELRSKYG